jgi:hypothetical protein
MTSNHILFPARDYANVSTTDRLALSRAQHLQSRENRPKSVSDDEVDAVSDWSDSDRECYPLSDFESTSHVDGDFYDIPFDDDNDENKLSQEIFHSNLPLLSTNGLDANETPVPIIDDSTTSTRISFTCENEKPKEEFNKKVSMNSQQLRKQFQPPLLPARRIQIKQISPHRPSTRSMVNSQLSSSRNCKTATPSPTRFYLRRETTSTSIISNTHLTKDSILSSNSSFHSHDDNHNQRSILSPNLSQVSVPRAYEIKKIFVDDYDYGRLTSLSSRRPFRPSSRQKWGTIVHPPFPLGYQQIPPEQVTQAVERLSSPLRCRDRHFPLRTPSRRFLSVEETEALVTKSFDFF